jgi:uncharacterized protein YjiS (DUF1127 family)
MSDDLDIATLSVRKFNGEDYSGWRRTAVRRAHRLRSRYALALLVGLANALASMARSARMLLNRMREAHADRRAAARLHALDDGALKDIGIRRSEIESIVHGGATDATRMCRDKQLAA